MQYQVKMFEKYGNFVTCFSCKDKIRLNDMKLQEIRYCRCKDVKMRIVNMKDCIDITKGKYQETFYK